MIFPLFVTEDAGQKDAIQMFHSCMQAHQRVEKAKHEGTELYILWEKLGTREDQPRLAESGWVIKLGVPFYKAFGELKGDWVVVKGLRRCLVKEQCEEQ